MKLIQTRFLMNLCAFFVLSILIPFHLKAQISRDSTTLFSQDSTVRLDTSANLIDSIKSNSSISTIGGGDWDYANPKEFQIGAIRVEGADNFDHQAILLIAGLRQGQKIMIPGDKITKAIDNLWKEDLFSKVDIYMDRVVANVAFMTIELQPKPKLSRFKIEGASKKDADKIREEIKLFAGKTISGSTVNMTKTKIKGYYRDKGFWTAKVDITQVPDTLLNNSEMFVIHVNRGQRIRIANIIIEGNHELTDAKIRKAMKDTKRKGLLRIFKKSKFLEYSYNIDKQSIIAKYNSVGMRNAQIVSDTFYLISDRDLLIKMKIDEGQKFYFGKIEWQGNTKYRSSFLDTILGIKYGDVYNKELLDTRLNMSQDGRDVSSLYMDKGYLFFNIQAIEKNIIDNHINYQIRLMEGSPAIVDNIIIKGNNKTSDYVIRREIRTKPGDLFNRNDIIRTQRELAQLGFFDEQGFQINPLPNPQKGTVDIEYTVAEKSSDQVELSGGYAIGRLILTAGLKFNNFSTRKFFHSDAWTPLPSGDGQKLALSAQTNGKYYQGYNVSFTEPWLGGKKPNSLSVWANHTSYSTSGVGKHKDGYQGIQQTGLGVALGRRKKIPDDFFAAQYELGYTYYDLNWQGFTENFEKGFSNDISFKYTLQRNSVSAPIYPQEGSNITFMFKTTAPYSLFSKNKDYTNVSGQDRYKYLEYYRFKFTTEYYFPLTPDRKLVLMSRIGLGYMGAYNTSKGITPFDRYRMGGSGMYGAYSFVGYQLLALRGYDDNSLSSEVGDPIAAKYTLELRYPLSLNPSATFYLLAFGEAGNTYTNFKSFNPLNVKRSAGVGLRVFLPMFGMLGVDYGWGFDTMDPHSDGYNKGSDISIRQKGYFGKFTFTIGMNLGEL